MYVEHIMLTMIIFLMVIVRKMHGWSRLLWICVVVCHFLGAVSIVHSGPTDANDANVTLADYLWYNAGRLTC